LSETNKPDYTNIWASGGAIVAPSTVKQQTGWTAEVPPFQWENWAQNRQDQAISHILQKGISVWSTTGEYYFTSGGERSYVQGSDGKIYVAVADSVNQNPVTDTSHTYWDVAFLTLADVYTKAQVDAKTTVASTAQAQALTSDTVLLSPLKLASAFQGANQNMATSGFQKIPGSGILIWGLVNISITSGAGSATVAMPTSFPTAFYQAVGTFVTSLGGSGGRCGINCPTLSTIQVDVAGVGTTTGTEGVRYFAWGR
jgi:hypothetical protein